MQSKGGGRIEEEMNVYQRNCGIASAGAGAGQLTIQVPQTAVTILNHSFTQKVLRMESRDVHGQISFVPPASASASALLLLLQ